MATSLRTWNVRITTLKDENPIHRVDYQVIAVSARVAVNKAFTALEPSRRRTAGLHYVITVAEIPS